MKSGINFICMNDKKIGWGIIGPGKIARKFAHDLKLAEGAVLQGVASRDTERARDFAREYGAKRYYGSYEELVNDPLVDIVYVATPHVFHFPHTMLSLQHGKAVLVEKPFGMNCREVQAMVAEARSRQLFLMEAFWTRFIPATEKLLELVNAGAVGDIEYIRADFGFVGDKDPERRVLNKELGGGSLLDVGIYPALFSILVLGVPETIRAMAKFTHTGVDGVCNMLFEHTGGKISVLESSITAKTPTEAMIFGTKGSIRMHTRFHHASAMTIEQYDTPAETHHFKYTGLGYYHEIMEAMECLRRNKTESDRMPLSLSLDLISTLDRVRSEIGLQYRADHA